jgi:ribosomal biogenesis protein LAS1
LQKVAESHPSVVVYLAEELVHNLVFSPANDSSNNARAEALYLWILHLLTSPEWEKLRPFFPRTYILIACSENPNHWANMLILCARLEGKPLKGAQPRAQSASQKRSKKETSQNGASLSDVDQKLREHGWGPVETWDSRPLGIASI